MKPKIEIRTSTSIVKRYRELLVRDPDQGIGTDVLSLLWATVASEHDRDMWIVLDPSGSIWANVPMSVLAKMAAIAPPDRFPKMLFPDLRMHESPVLIARHAAGWLTLQGWTRPSGNLGLLRDLQSLLVLSSLREILPPLKGKKAFEHTYLLHAVRFNIMMVQSESPEQSYYLQSSMFEYLGWKQQMMSSLLSSFRLTPPSDHSYLTKAQDYWSCLLDDKRTAEADQFLFELYKNAPTECQTEIAAMRQLTVGGRKKAVAR